MSVKLEDLEAPPGCPFVYVGETSGNIFFCFEIAGEKCNFTTARMLPRARQQTRRYERRARRLTPPLIPSGKPIR